MVYLLEMVRPQEGRNTIFGEKQVLDGFIYMNVKRC